MLDGVVRVGSQASEMFDSEATIVHKKNHRLKDLKKEEEGEERKKN